VSSPVIPLDDPTLLFVNAGMNQFKDVFTGRRRVSYKRAVTVQKCIRAGGKHNDLENVGQTSRHHTFFEMLGNFSFGDYFKEEAIASAWEWITKTLGLPPNRLYATVYTEDDEAFGLWQKIAPELKNGRILRFGKKDNYWAMGDVGPCGPCSEIHVDRGKHLSKNQPDAWINTDSERYVEIWNLVFMQYDQLPDGGELVPLPEPSVDTGAGLERIAAVMQKVDSNYETDLFLPLTAHVADITGARYDPGPGGTSHRVIADHVRALSFALADGGGLSNEGRGYVLRRILRRAARHGRLLRHKKPIIYKLVPTLINIMGKHYGELREKQKHIEEVVKSEEERFGDLLDTGLELFSTLEQKVKSSGSDTIPGEDIFKLYDTYGFPVDMTEIMADEAGLKLDMDGFDIAMHRQQEQSRAASQFGNDFEIGFKNTLDIMIGDGEIIDKSDFVSGEKSEVFEVDTKVVNGEMLDIREIQTVFHNGKEKTLDVYKKRRAAVLLEKTPFYSEAGGQVSDIGVIANDKAMMIVDKAIKYKGVTAHFGELKKGELTDLDGQSVTARIDKDRRLDIMRNHTATHLLHAALRQVIGEHVKQSGSLVEPDRLRFDFTHFKALTPEQISAVEKIVNEKILAAIPVTTETKSTEEAMKSGAMALFGEKYGDEVRVVSIGDFSKELCGGTHVTNTSEIGSFLITGESAIAAGVRRIEAATGRKAVELSHSSYRKMKDIGVTLNVPVESLSEEIKNLSQRVKTQDKEMKKLRVERVAHTVQLTYASKKIVDVDLFPKNLGGTDPDSMSGWADNFKGYPNPTIAFAFGNISGKVTFIASASPATVEMGLDVGKIFGEIAKEFGGRGGGKASFARGGLPGEITFEEFLDKAITKIREAQT
jgi:alanyl-tRNA synthetase